MVLFNDTNFRQQNSDSEVAQNIRDLTRLHKDHRETHTGNSEYTENDFDYLDYYNSIV